MLLLGYSPGRGVIRLSLSSARPIQPRMPRSLLVDEPPIGRVRLVHPVGEHLLVYVTAALAGAGAVGWAAWCLLTEPGPGAQRGAEVILRAMALVGMPLLWYALRSIRRLHPRAALSVFGDRLEIRERDLFTRPAVVFRDDVSHVAVAVEAEIRGDERLRFRIDTGERWLFSSLRGSRLPHVARTPKRMNLAIVFAHPQRFPQARAAGHAALTGPAEGVECGGPGFRRVSRHDDAPGLLLRVADPAAATALLSTWGSEPSSTVTDLALGPTPSTARDVPYRRRLVLATLLIATAVGVGLGSVASAVAVAAIVTLAHAAGRLELRAALAERSRWPAFVALAGACMLLVALPFA